MSRVREEGKRHRRVKGGRVGCGRRSEPSRTQTAVLDLAGRDQETLPTRRELLAHHRRPATGWAAVRQGEVRKSSAGWRRTKEEEGEAFR